LRQCTSKAVSKRGNEASKFFQILSDRPHTVGYSLSPLPTGPILTAYFFFCPRIIWILLLSLAVPVASLFIFQLVLLVCSLGTQATHHPIPFSPNPQEFADLTIIRFQLSPPCRMSERVSRHRFSESGLSRCPIAMPLLIQPGGVCSLPPPKRS